MELIPISPREISEVLETKKSDRIVMSLDGCIREWLDSMKKLSESDKTEKAYSTEIEGFREELKKIRLDLDGDPAEIAPLARRWCDRSSKVEQVSQATFNQRRSILSSFYEYAVVNEVVEINPVKRFKTRKIRNKNAARPIDKSDVHQAIASIDVSTPEGKRDKALLAVALTTGRRVSELSGLLLKHLTRQGSQILLFWERCKENETASNLLDEKTTAVLSSYLESIYGDLAQQSPESPVWIAFSKNPKYQGTQIGIRAIERITKKHLKTSKAHAMRHTFAVSMHKRGASLMEIGKALNHKNLKTTSDYMNEQLGYENAYAKDLAEDFGI